MLFFLTNTKHTGSLFVVRGDGFNTCFYKRMVNQSRCSPAFNGSLIIAIGCLIYVVGFMKLFQDNNFCQFLTCKGHPLLDLWKKYTIVSFQREVAWCVQ